MAPKRGRGRGSQPHEPDPSAGRPAATVAERPALDDTRGSSDEEPVPPRRRARAARARIEAEGPAGDDASVDGRRAASSAGGSRVITDLRQNSIENLRVEHRRLKTATRQAQRDVRNAKRRRNRILARIRNLDAESILSVLIDRGMPESMTPPELTAVLPPQQPAAAVSAPAAASSHDAEQDADDESDHEETGAAPSEGPAEDEAALDLDDLASAQPPVATALPADQLEAASVPTDETASRPATSSVKLAALTGA